MFTVLHRSSTGSETLYEAERVMWIPPGTQQQSQKSCAAGDDEPGIYLTRPNGERVTLFREHPREQNTPDPEVYVMNASGKTVAKYAMN